MPATIQVIAEFADDPALFDNKLLNVSATDELTLDPGFIVADKSLLLVGTAHYRLESAPSATIYLNYEIESSREEGQECYLSKDHTELVGQVDTDGTGSIPFNAGYTWFNSSDKCTAAKIWLTMVSTHTENVLTHTEVTKIRPNKGDIVPIILQLLIYQNPDLIYQ
jgi:hypothetical protein